MWCNLKYDKNKIEEFLTATTIVYLPLIYLKKHMVILISLIKIKYLFMTAYVSTKKFMTTKQLSD